MAAAKSPEQREQELRERLERIEALEREIKARERAVKAKEGVTAQALKESLTYTTVGNIENNHSKLYGRWTQFRIKMIPINFITWIGRAIGID